MEITREEQLILHELCLHSHSGNVMEFLQFDSSRFEEAFMIANQLQNKNAIKLLYSNFNKNLIVVEITLLGIRLAKK